MTLCGIEQCKPDYMFCTGQRSGYHLHVILSGKGTLSVNGVQHELHFGQMFMTKPEEDTWYRADKNDPWAYCWIAFDGNNAKRYAESAGFRPGVNWQDCHIDHQKFYSCVQQVLNQPQLTLANDLNRLGLLLAYIGLAIESNYRAEQVVRHEHEYSTDAYVQYAMDFIHSNYASVKVGDVAGYIGIHRSYLTNIFKKKMGISPQEYLMQCKLKQGCKLLLETELPIQEVSQRIGYENPLTFSKVFKNTFGISPRSYRLQNGGTVEIDHTDEENLSLNMGEGI